VPVPLTSTEFFPFCRDHSRLFFARDKSRAPTSHIKLATELVFAGNLYLLISI